MFIPAYDTLFEMKSEPVGLWCVEVDEYTYPQFVVKLPVNIIKSLNFGCKITMVIDLLNYRDLVYFAYGLIVWDDYKKPYITYDVMRNEKDFKLFMNCLERRKTIMHFFDEIERPIVSSECCLKLKLKNPLLTDHLNDYHIDTLSRSVDDELFKLYKNNIENYINGINDYDEISTLSLFEVDLIFGEAVRINAPDVGRFCLDHKDEGGGFEQSIFQLVESVYTTENSLRSPILDNHNQREIIDIMAWDKTHICLIEAKCLSIFNRGAELTNDRRIKNINGQVTKAIKQLKGAVRTINGGKNIFREPGILLELPSKSSELIHCIVLISEMYPFLDWENIACQIIDLNEEVKAFFHVMDLTELRRLIASSKDPSNICCNLFRRWEAVSSNKNALVRGSLKPT